MKLVKMDKLIKQNKTPIKLKFFIIFNFLFNASNSSALCWNFFFLFLRALSLFPFVCHSHPICMFPDGSWITSTSLHAPKCYKTLKKNTFLLTHFLVWFFVCLFFRIYDFVPSVQIMGDYATQDLISIKMENLPLCQ